MTKLATLTAAVAAGIDTKTLFSIRAPKLVPGENYVMSAWTGKEKTKRAVEFVGVGPAIDELVEKTPRLKDLGEGQFFFFKALDADGNDEVVAAFGYGDVLCIGIPQVKDGIEASVATRVTFFSETAPVKAAPAPKAPKAPKASKADKAKEVVDTTNPEALAAAEEASAAAEETQLAEIVDAETGVTEETTEA